MSRQRTGAPYIKNVYVEHDNVDEQGKEDRQGVWMVVKVRGAATGDPRQMVKLCFVEDANPGYFDPFS
ncbi:hypothetical protein O3P69_002408 [Scylla paramamosain]|uniref:Uncharacterized protein n=1 Tax=Scylla paramamosain TaxID=85552 RepID=A0AAW0V689_SCYPA